MQLWEERKSMLIGMLFLTVGFAAIVGVSLIQQAQSNPQTTGATSDPNAPPANNPGKLVSLGYESGVISILQGTVQMSVDNMTFATIENGQKLEIGNRVRTGQDGRALIILADNSLITLDHNSEIQLRDMRVNDYGASTKVFLYAGRIFNHVQKITTGTQNYTVETNNAIASVRGTAFMVELISNGEQFAVSEGTILITGKKDLSSTEVTVGQQRFVSITGVNPPQMIDLSQWATDWKNTYLCNMVTGQQLTLIEKKYGELQQKYLEFNNCGNEEYASKHNSYVSSDAEIDPNNPSAPPAVGQTPTPTPAPPAGSQTVPTSDTPTGPIQASVKGINISAVANQIKCGWGGTNANYFLVSVSTSPGQNNVLDWGQTADSYGEFSNLNLVNGSTYYCNVQAVSPTGHSSAIVSSNGIYYDYSIAAFGNIFPSQGNSNWNGDISLVGNFSDMALTDLAASFSVRRSTDSQFLNGQGIWQTAAYFFPLALGEDGPGFQSTVFSIHGMDAGTAVTLNFLLKNNATQKNLDNFTVANLTYQPSEG